MKKNMLKVAFVAAVAMVAGINVFHAQKTETLSDVAMANVEALADHEMNTEDCVYAPNQECIVIDVTPTGNYGRIYFDQRNKIIY